MTNHRTPNNTQNGMLVADRQICHPEYNFKYRYLMPAGRIIHQRVRINKTYGLFIGINEFAYMPQFRLNGCVRDAEDLSTAFAPDHTAVLLDQNATRKEILGVVNTYLKALGKGDLLIVTVSAHGGIVNKDLAIFPHDAEPDNHLGTTLSTLYLLNALSSMSENGAKVLIILDICHSGAINFDLSKYSGALSGGGISTIYGCGPNETAKEQAFESGEHRGVFTKFILDGLNGGADLDGHHIITLRDLYDFVYRNVCNTVEGQHPALIGTLEGNTIIKTLH